MRRFRLRYTGGTLMLVWITFLSMLIIFIPFALVLLIEGIEIVEVRN